MKFKFIGHCYNPSENHDKVWGAIYLDAPDAYPCRVLTVWGRRGKKLSTKMVTNGNDLSKLIRAKENKGYREISKNRLDEVYPEFEDDLEKTAIWAMLKL
jgi:predicted DNA-binding WGR domain protein